VPPLGCRVEPNTTPNNLGGGDAREPAPATGGRVGASGLPRTGRQWPGAARRWGPTTTVNDALAGWVLDAPSRRPGRGVPPVCRTPVYGRKSEPSSGGCWTSSRTSSVRRTPPWWTRWRPCWRTWSSGPAALRSPVPRDEPPVGPVAALDAEAVAVLASPMERGSASRRTRAVLQAIERRGASRRAGGRNTNGRSGNPQRGRPRPRSLVVQLHERGHTRAPRASEHARRGHRLSLVHERARNHDPGQAVRGDVYFSVAAFKRNRNRPGTTADLQAGRGWTTLTPLPEVPSRGADRWQRPT
jgi:hypothetical protein